MAPARYLAALLIAWPAAAVEPPPPDAEFLEFLGETADEDLEFILFMESREAERALSRIEAEQTKEDDDDK